MDVRIDLSRFSQAYGGSYGERLRVLAYPSCYLDTPELDACGLGVPVEMSHSASDHLSFTTISADDLTEQLALWSDEEADGEAEPSSHASESQRSTVHALAAVAAADPDPVDDPLPGVVYALAAGPGAYGSTPLSMSSEWQVGEGSGEFSYTYPFSFPSPLGFEAAGMDGVSLNYSSGSVDGMTSAENGQASEVGLGWNLDPGSISRSYGSCHDDGWGARGDMCWVTRTVDGNSEPVEQVSLTLNGKSTRLIQNGTSNQWRAQDDPTWKVTKLTGDSNGDDGGSGDAGESWKITTPDGYEYQFGRHADSAQVVPVFGNDAGEPCFKTDKPMQSWCDQAWSWRMDAAIDPSGNRTLFSYDEESNYYNWYTQKNILRKYDRAATISKIEYAEDLNSNVINSSRFRALVEFSTTGRCDAALDAPGAGCAGITAPSRWPDTPRDLICAANDGEDCGNATPTFFSTKRYYKVATSTVKLGENNGLIITPVENWVFDHTFIDPDGNGNEQPDLWLNKIRRTGTAGGQSLSMKEINFDGVQKRNRVVPTQSGLYMKKFRIASVQNEMGGHIDVVYGHDPTRICDASYVSNLERWQSTRECFPQKGTPNAPNGWAWFHKYVVTRVSLGDDTMGYRLPGSDQDQSRTDQGTNLARLRTYEYEYLGAPAWRYVTRRNLPVDDRTWGDWRGYEGVKVHTVKTGTGSDRADWSVRYIVRFRGMNETWKTPTTRWDNVRITTLEHGGDTNEQYDSDAYQGKVAEETVYDADKTTKLSRTYHQFASWKTIADDNGPDGWLVVEPHTHTYKYGSGGTVTSAIHRSFNDGGSDHLGLLAGVQTRQSEIGFSGGSAGASSQRNRCITTAWKSGSTNWIRAPQAVTVYGDACSAVPEGDDPGDSDANRPDVDSKTITYYDGTEATPDGNLSRGLATTVRHFTGSSSISGGDVTTRAKYDRYGRPTVNYDGNGNETRTYYNTVPTQADLTAQQNRTQGIDAAAASMDARDETGNLLTLITTVGPTGLIKSSRLDSRRGQPVVQTDENGKKTQIGYDPLGRLTDVWLPGYPVDGPANISHTYEISQSDVSRVVTSTLRNANGGAGGSDVSYTFFDGWGRQVETQVPQAEGANRTVVATGYDGQGLVQYTVPEYADNNQNNYSQPVNGNPLDAPRFIKNTYDGAGRPVTLEQRAGTTLKAKTTTTYGGDRAWVEPPAAKGRTTNIYDAWGNTIGVWKSNSPTGGTGTIEDSTAMTYDALNQLQSISKTIADNPATWSYRYDWAGRLTRAVDPDVGTTNYTSDDNSNVLRTTTPTDVINTSYDALDRPTETTAGPDASTQPTKATWTYDSGANGLGRLSSAASTTPMGKITSAVDGYTDQGYPTATTWTYPAALTGEGANPAGGTTRTLTTGYTYNARGDVINTSYPATAGLHALSVGASYAAKGRFKALTGTATDATGQQVGDQITIGTATYNLRNQVGSLTSTSGSGELTNDLKRSYGYDSSTGWISNISGTLTNPVVQASATDPSAATTALSLDYTYDPLGQPTRIAASQTAANGATTKNAAWCYTYDTLNRLSNARTGVANTNDAGCTTSGTTTAGVTGDDYNLTYSYQGDRITGVTDNAGGTNTYTYSASGPHQTSSIGGTFTSGLPTPGALEYDAAGRISKSLPASPGGTADEQPDTTYIYNYQGHPETSTPVAGTPNADTAPSATYGYDTTGNRLVARFTTPATTTKAGKVVTTTYLGNIEITRTRPIATPGATPGTGSNSALRRFTTPGGTPLATQSGTGTGKWDFELADTQNSVRLTATYNGTPSGGAQAGTAPAFHNYYPFGEQTQTTKTSHTDTPLNQRGYLNKPADPGGDIRLDQRNYTASLNIFTTPDPILDLTTPATLNPYAYSQNNPIAYSDPTGLFATNESHSHTNCQVTSCGGSGGGSWSGNGGTITRDELEDIIDNANNTFLDGFTDGAGDEFAATAEALKPSAVLENLKDAIHSIDSVGDIWGIIKSVAASITHIDELKDIYDAAVSGDEYAFGKALGKFAVSAGSDILATVIGAGAAKLAAKATQAVGEAAKLSEAVSSSAAKTCLRSFGGNTPVLMAGGQLKPIKKIAVGDYVVATDPETGKRVKRRVNAVWVHRDVLQSLSLADRTTLTVTPDHLIWSVTDHAFERANQLASGEVVLSDRVGTVAVAGLEAGSSRVALAYNLSIEGVHTYHVGADAILVHNDCGPTLIYEANPKHGPVSRPGPRGEISRAPRGDCQAMLECSTQVKTQLRQRVEPGTGLTVIFRRHREFDGTEWWHGYVPEG